MPLVSQVRGLLLPFARTVRRHALPRLLRPPPAGRAQTGNARSARVVGLLSSASGLGNSARLCADQLMSSGFAVSGVDVAPLFGASDGVGYATNAGDAPCEAISLYHLNPPKLLPGILRGGLRKYRRTYNIAYWAWELETLPRDWVESIRFVDAILVPSEFCRAAVARYTDRPVRVVPHPVDPNLAPPRRERDKDAPFTVLSMLNFGSSFERKNPYASLRAFQSAFGADPGAQLLFKTSGGHRYPAELARLREEVGEAANVAVIDALWSEEQLRQLYGRVDAYLSLHRSEGYGLTIAEAMMMECPVVVTAWSGNMDFCGNDSAFLVNYDLVDFQDNDPAYEGVRNARWADPSAEHAAHILQTIRAQPELGRNKAKHARRALLDHTQANSYERAVTSLLAA
jgi:glycosyltransferase involved in cell wall biosynthesis